MNIVKKGTFVLIDNNIGDFGYYQKIFLFDSTKKVRTIMSERKMEVMLYQGKEKLKQVCNLVTNVIENNNPSMKERLCFVQDDSCKICDEYVAMSGETCFMLMKMYPYKTLAANDSELARQGYATKNYNCPFNNDRFISNESFTELLNVYRKLMINELTMQDIDDHYRFLQCLNYLAQENYSDEMMNETNVLVKKYAK